MDNGQHAHQLSKTRSRRSLRRTVNTFLELIFDNHGRSKKLTKTAVCTRYLRLSNDTSDISGVSEVSEAQEPKEPLEEALEEAHAFGIEAFGCSPSLQLQTSRFFGKSLSRLRACGTSVIADRG